MLPSIATASFLRDALSAAGLVGVSFECLQNSALCLSFCSLRLSTPFNLQAFPQRPIHRTTCAIFAPTCISDGFVGRPWLFPPATLLAGSRLLACALLCAAPLSPHCLLEPSPQQQPTW